MRFLADVDQPPKSRLPGLVIGVVLAVPVVALVVGWLVPSAVGSILGGAKEFDSRLRATDTYLLTLCNTAMQPGRDDELCGCVLAMEFPALDCRGPFNEWAIERQRLACSDPEVHETALSYCTCVETVAQRMDAAEDDDGRRRESATYESCESLEDALPLPAVASEDGPPA